MKKIFTYSSFVLCFLFSSCNSDKTKESSATTDSIPEISIDSATQKLISLFKNDGTLPFVADTALINK